MKTFENFSECISDALIEALTDKGVENVTTQVLPIKKLQGDSYTGLSVCAGDSHASAVYDLTTAYSKYQDGICYTSILNHAVKQIMEALAALPDMPFDILCNYSVMKDHMTVQLVSKSHNEPSLEGVAYTEVAEDLILVYRLMIPAFDNKEGSILIRNEHLDPIGVSLEQVHHDALLKAAELQPMKFVPLAAFLAQTMGLNEEDKRLPDPEIWIVTNQSMCLGASALFYPGALEMISNQLGGGNFYIIPSSIHECLVCSDKSCSSWEWLERILNEVNATVVDSDEVLSDQLYFYNSITKAVELAATMQTPTPSF